MGRHKPVWANETQRTNQPWADQAAFLAVFMKNFLCAVVSNHLGNLNRLKPHS